MQIEKIVVKNFKKFKDNTFEFNEDVNILVGDNASGKSTILEAIDIALNNSYCGRAISGNLSIDMFNNDSIQEFIASDKTQDKLPEILIEAYIANCPDHKGNNNSLKVDCDGIFVRIAFDQDLGTDYADFLHENPDLKTIPIEFYKAEWFYFSWKRATKFSKQIKCFFVDPPRLHPTFGSKKYISDIVNSNLEPNTRSILNLNFRRLKQQFDEEEDIKKLNKGLDSENKVTEKDLEISVNFASQTTWENNLQLNVDEVPFSQIGDGEQRQIRIKLALWQKSKDTHIVMIEEPENHLSHINLVKLIKYIEDNAVGQQIFITTHSSYVLNKLNFGKVCLISNEYKRLSDVDFSTVKTLKRLPGYDTLRAVLCTKIILVEGPSDELLLKKIHLINHGNLPEENGIDIIVVRGIGFKNYLNIIQHLRHQVHVVKDNDGNHQGNIEEWKNPYVDFDFIKVFSPTNDACSSLEPALVDANSGELCQLDKLAEIILGPNILKNYQNLGKNIPTREAFLRGRYQGQNSGGEKVDAAMRLFESDEDIIFPAYLTEALNFDA